MLAFLSLPNRKETGERLSLPKAIETTTAPLRIAKFSTRRFLSLLALQKGEVFFYILFKKEEGGAIFGAYNSRGLVYMC